MLRSQLYNVFIFNTLRFLRGQHYGQLLICPNQLNALARQTDRTHQDRQPRDPNANQSPLPHFFPCCLPSRNDADGKTAPRYHTGLIPLM
jgi:hypothetical protein